mgnify:CR=1 FL=1
MAAASDYLEGEIIKHIFRTGSFTKPSVLAIALCTAAPVDADTGALTSKEVSGGGYLRQALNPLDANWTAPGVGGLTDNASIITFPTATANWGTVTHVAICDNQTVGAGNLLLHGALTASKVVNTNDIFRFNIGDLDCTVA